MENLNNVIRNKITNFARIVISFNEEEFINYNSPIVKLINANATLYSIQLENSQIILSGKFSDTIQFLKNLDVSLDLYKIESADVECFSLEEELFKDGLANPKLMYNFNKEKLTQYQRDDKILIEVRENYKQFLKNGN